MAVRVKVAEGGRVVIPAEYQRSLNLQVGDDVVMELEDGEIHLMSIRHAIENSQRLVRQHVPEGRSLLDELIAERRAEASAE